jgi:hypothetical protein
MTALDQRLHTIEMQIQTLSAERIEQFTVFNEADLDLLPTLKSEMDGQRQAIRKAVADTVEQIGTFPIELRQNRRFDVDGATVFLAEVKPDTKAAGHIDGIVDQIEATFPAYGEEEFCVDPAELEALIPGARWKHVNQDIYEAQVAYLARLAYDASDVAAWLDQQDAEVEISSWGLCPTLIVRDPSVAAYLKLAFAH